jgi:hypothetical protein
MNTVRPLKTRNDATTAALSNYEAFSYFYDNGHRSYIERINKTYDFVRGRQWNAVDKARLDAQGRPALTVNQLLPTYAVILGEFLANRADVTFLPVKDGSDEVADALSRLWINTANNNKLDWYELMVIERGLLAGRGYIDMRVDFDNQMQGEIVMRAPRPHSVMLDPDLDSPFTKDWPQVVESRWMTLVEIENLFGTETAERVKFVGAENMLGSQSVYERPNRRDMPSRGNIDPAYNKQYRVIDRQHRLVRTGEWFVDVDSGDMREVPDGWPRNRIAEFLRRYPQVAITKRQYKDVRWTVSIDHISLHDDWSPYDDFTIVPYFPFFLDGEPVSLFEQLLGSQELLNKSLSQELHILNTSSNSGWKYKSGALVGMTREDLERRGAETGLVIEIAGDPDKDLVKIQPNNVPTGHDRMSFKAAENIKTISLVSDTMRGFDREDVSSKAILAKSARSSISLALAFNGMNRLRQDLAERALGMFQQFYVEPRLLSITGGSSIEPKSEQFGINQPTPEGTIATDLQLGKYSVVVTPAPSRATINESEFQELTQLRELGVPVPADAFLEASHIPNKKRLLQAIRGLSGGEDPAAADMAQRKAEQEQAQLEAQVAQADMALKQANANLANARAEKIGEDAQNVPNEQALKEAQHAAQVERDRTAALLDARRIAAKERTDRTSQAIDVAKMDSDRQQHNETMKASVLKNKQAGSTKKPPSPKKKA